MNMTVTPSRRGKMMHFHYHAHENKPAENNQLNSNVFTADGRNSLRVRNHLKPFQCCRSWNMQHQLLRPDDAELLLSVSESVSSLLPLLAPLWAPGLDLDVSSLAGSSEAPLLWHGVTDGGLLINVGRHCREEDYCHSQKACPKIEPGDT